MAARRAKTPAKKKKSVVVPKASGAKKTAKLEKKVGAKKTATRKAPAKKKFAPAPEKRAAKPKVRAAKKGRTSSVPPATERSPRPFTDARAAGGTPSERLLAACAELPTERALTDEEREAMAKISETARRFVGATGAPPEVIGSIATFLDEVRGGKREEPKSQDIRLGLGVLWGEQLRAQVGWRWVHLTYPDGFASYALVPDDRAFACFPLNRVPEALRAFTANTSAHVFQSIRENALPTRKANAYLVIG